ncbi:MAG: protein kinase [Deltaproteobacteria bacterium]|nr:protein kinase [Deltaproteobacteria bacterium]
MRFGNYELIEKLSSGGMAEVFRARLVGRDGFVKEFAIKRILPHLATDENFGRLFINEARVAARLRHANIVQVFDFGDVAGSPFIAMELIEGCDLRSIQKLLSSRHERLPVELTAAICSQVLNALHYAHTLTDDQGMPLGIIHRDISPHNVLLSRAGEVKLADFGIAKAVFTTAHTAQGLVRGKLQYMSPQQIQGRTLTQKTDIFSLGVIWYELLVGDRIYTAKRGLNLVQQILHAELRPPSSRAPVPEPLERIVMSMLERDPDQRPDARAALNELQQAGWAQNQSLAISDLLRRIEQPGGGQVAAASDVPANQDQKDSRRQPPNAVPQDLRSDAPTLILEENLDPDTNVPLFGNDVPAQKDANQPQPKPQAPHTSKPPRFPAGNKPPAGPTKKQPISEAPSRTTPQGIFRIFLRGGLALGLLAALLIILWTTLHHKGKQTPTISPCAPLRRPASLTLTRPARATPIGVSIDGRPLPLGAHHVVLPPGVHRLKFARTTGRRCGITQILAPAGASLSIAIPPACFAESRPKDQVQP